MTARGVTPPRRRGACPGLSAPMATGDGLLVRLLPIGTIPLASFSAMCAAARAHGNGVVEITARGSIQVRGLSQTSAPLFAAAIAALDIAAEDGVPIVCNPLAGLDPEELFDAGTIATDLRQTIAHHSLAARVGAKVSVAIDGGGSLDLDRLAADVRLRAAGMKDNVALRVSIGGDAASAAKLGSVAAADGAEAAMRLLEILAQRGGDTRARDILAAEGIAVFRSAIADLLALSARPRERGGPELDSRLRGNERLAKDGLDKAIGVHRLRDGSLAVGVGLAFGHADATTLERLAELARTAGAYGMRTAPGQTLITIGLTQETLSGFTAAAEQLGFIVRPGDPRRYVFACAGAPVCASALIAARSIAPLIAEAAAPHLGGSFTIHISGCAKGCAHPAPAALTIVGTDNGCALVAHGTARDDPFDVLTMDELPAAIARHSRALKREARHA
jgi:precorrin-3B synthase